MKQLLLILLVFISFTQIIAQTPYLLKDIMPGNAGGFAQSSQYLYYEHPFNVVWEKNGIIYFTAVGYNTVPNGGAYTNDVELWQSDGTAAGTVMLKDINPGNEGSYPSDFVVINGTLYFTAYTPSSGVELWKTDGTNSGTVMVKEIISGSVGGFQTSAQFGYNTIPFSVVWQNGGYFYFIANNYASAPGGNINDVELWKSDGTDGGTMVVKDIFPGNESSGPSGFIDINGTLYFTAYNAASGRELWKSDGSAAGTILVKDIIAGAIGGFSISGQWGYDPYQFSVVWQNGGSFYFTANNYASPPGQYINDIELWKSDGTDGGTIMVKDIYPGYESSYPQNFTEINNSLYFTAYNATSGRELWKSDGTPGGTVIVKEIIAGAVGGFSLSGQWGYDPHQFNVVWQNGGSFYFTANNYASAPGQYINDVELWKSDGTSGGTVMVKDIYSGYESSYPRDFSEINGLLFFTAYNASSGRELWKSDGTNGGTQLVKEIINGSVGGFETSGQFGYYLHPFSVIWQSGSLFYFTANNFASAPGGNINDIELWKSDGTDAGTMMVKDIYPGQESSYPQDFINMNGLHYFTAYNAASGREMWKTDGTNAGTVLVKEIMSGNVGGFNMADQYAYSTLSFQVAFNIGSYFYFVANDYATVPTGSGYENNPELWRSDGTDAGTSKVLEIHPSSTFGSYPAYFTNRLGKIFFTATDPVNGRELWVIDVPVSDGTELISELNWNLYPNPSADKVYINCSVNVNDALESISITDLSGKEVYAETCSGQKNFYIKTIDTGNLVPGTYFVKLTSTRHTSVRKLIRQGHF